MYDLYFWKNWLVFLVDWFGVWSHLVMRASQAAALKDMSPEGQWRDPPLQKHGSVGWYQVADTVDGRNPTNQLRLVVYPIFLEGFLHPRWCRISSINSSDHRLDVVLFFSHRKLCQMVWPRHLTNMWIWNTHETSCSRQDRWQKKRDLYRLIDTTEPTERRSGGGTGKWCIQGI